MKVKIGDTWYSAEDQPIAVMFEDVELELVKGMTRENAPSLRFTAGPVQADEDDSVLLEWAKR
ncbi:hypothetical protein AB1A96_03535 [Pseudomonas juntendi]|uniref:hypothetical protein n=1 Tax=Pseudomonas juntendi TaxID=2666183 RepID=UPI00289925DA|nr:hypothetical protein [Pseudomonas juntendi]